MAPAPTDSRAVADEAMKLDRSSAVPLYHQLQETLKQQIESGRWKPGYALPSEPELARRFGVSRVVVRMALGVLEDDHQIVRIRGRGTFVSKPKLNYRAGGLSRMLESLEDEELVIEVLDRTVLVPEGAVRKGLGAEADEETLRLLSLVRLRGTALAIGYSFFRRIDVPWIEEHVVAGAALPHDPELAPSAHGIELAHAEVALESAASGKFDAEHFDLPLRSPSFLISAVEHRRSKDGTAPFEVARFNYRADILQFRLEVAPDAATRIQATWALVDSGWPPPAGEG